MPNWKPTADVAALKKRAEILQQIRRFFADRHVLEVDTPLLSPTTVTDPHVAGIPAIFQPNGMPAQTVYLQTSPEYAMKRLLAAGMGSIYQICKAFRQGDLGRVHQPEFTMLEWYRIGFDHHALMDEMDALLQQVLNTQPAERMSYAALFESVLEINPHTSSLSDLIHCIEQHNITLLSAPTDQDTALMLLLTHCIEPVIGQQKPFFLYDFPLSQAALARIRIHETPPVASRFEVYFKGLELANGFHELHEAAEQRARFEADIRYRREHNMLIPPIDELFLEALKAGLPDCSGVALGVDRLIMIALGVNSIEDVVSFGF